MGLLSEGWCVTIPPTFAQLPLCTSLAAVAEADVLLFPASLCEHANEVCHARELRYALPFHNPSGPCNMCIAILIDMVADGWGSNWRHVQLRIHHDNEDISTVPNAQVRSVHYQKPNPHAHSHTTSPPSQKDPRLPFAQKLSPTPVALARSILRGTP